MIRSTVNLDNCRLIKLTVIREDAKKPETPEQPGSPESPVIEGEKNSDTTEGSDLPKTATTMYTLLALGLLLIGLGTNFTIFY